MSSAEGRNHPLLSLGGLFTTELSFKSYSTSRRASIMSEFSNNEVSRGGNSLSIDPIVLETAEQVLSGIGISMSSYIEMCLRQVAQSSTVPFSPLDDPEFWMAERAIRAAYHKYETGEYRAAKKLIEEISEELNTRYMNFAMHLIGSQPTGNTNQLPAFMMLEKQYISQLDTMDIADLEDRLKGISKAARSLIITDAQTTDSGEENETIDTLEMAASFFDDLASYVESAVDLHFIHNGPAIPVSNNDAALSHDDKLVYLDETYNGTLDCAKRWQQQLERHFQYRDGRHALREIERDLIKRNKHRPNLETKKNSDTSNNQAGNS